MEKIFEQIETLNYKIWLSTKKDPNKVKADRLFEERKHLYLKLHEQNKDKILVLDIETTGLHSKESILEVGIVELDLTTGERNIIFDSLCYEDSYDPNKKYWVFDNGYMKPEELKDAPHFKDIKERIQTILFSYPNGATAFNKAFDFDKFLMQRGLKFPKVLDCPMVLLTNVCKLPKTNGGYGFKWPKVEEAWEFLFGKETGYVELHRGADDALHEAQIVYEIFKRGIFKVKGFEKKFEFKTNSPK